MNAANKPSNMPDHPDALGDHAVALLQQGRTDEALQLLLTGSARYPDHCVLRHNLAELYRNMGEREKAETLFLSILEQYPRFVPSYRSLITLLKEQLATATIPPGQRTQIVQRLAILINNMGNAVLETGQVEAAASAYQEALQLWPHYPSALSNLSNTARTMGQITEAETLARRALALRPPFAEAWNNLGSALAEQGRMQEAALSYQNALHANPDLGEARHNAGSGSLFMQLYREDLSTAEIVEAHREWGQAHPAPAHIAASPDDKGKLRVGFISGDFREHAMMQFVIPVLERLDRTQFNITCYANQTVEDGMTASIRRLPLTWKNIAMVSDEDLRTLLAQDDLHLLIDLSGHTRSNRLYALADKPVARMAHWLGYMFTSGLPAFDYRLTDPWTDPPATSATQHTEQPVYLTRSQFIYRPKDVVPPVNDLPALRNGYVTFGSLNNIQKLNRHVVAAWSQLLLAVPQSRLLLQTKLLADHGIVGRIRGMFEAFGVPVERLDLRPSSADYLQTYHAIDIALDPFPYNGGTTSCDALWMGVPVLTMAGDRSVGRMGVSILSALGMESWVGHSVEEYVALGRQHATSLEALAEIRARLRNRFTQSNLRDEQAFAEEFAGCIKKMVES